MRLWHVNWAAVGRHTLFAGEHDLLDGARALARTGPVLFAAADDHAHGVWLWTEAEAPAKASGVCRALGSITPVDLQPGHRVPIEGRRHLETLVGYHVRQPQKHGLAADPATYPGTCLADLVGARRLPGFDAEAIQRLLPRWRPAFLLADLGLGGELKPAGADEVAAALGPAHIVRIAAAAFGLASLAGRAQEVVAARRACVAILADQPGGTTAAADVLGITRGSARRMAAAAGPEDVQLLRRALAFALRLLHRDRGAA